VSEESKDIGRAERTASDGALVPRTNDKCVFDVATGEFVDGLFRFDRLPTSVTVSAGRDNFLSVMVSTMEGLELTDVQATASEDPEGVISLVESHENVWLLYWRNQMGVKVAPRGKCQYMFVLRKGK
jgi:hypothetical protein